MMDDIKRAVDESILSAAYDLRRLIAARDVMDGATDTIIREQVIDIITDADDERDPLNGLYAKVTADQPVEAAHVADEDKPVTAKAKPTIKPPRARNAAKRKTKALNLTPADIAAIRASREPQMTIAAQYHISRGTVQNIRSRKGAYANV